MSGDNPQGASVTFVVLSVAAAVAVILRRDVPTNGAGAPLQLG
jgi:hypothetical protein